MKPCTLTLLLVLVSSLAACPASGGDRIVGEPFATRSPVIAKHGMVASAHPLASQIGLDVLRGGGNAMDAAIAVNAALGLMEPTGCGIGGDLFAIIWSEKEKKLYGLNASGRSPRGLSLDRMKQSLKAAGSPDSIPYYHGLAVTVPGTVSGWFAIHGAFGTRPMSELLAPAIRAAEEGVPMPQVIAYYFGASKSRYRGFPEWGELYLKPDGSSYQEGDLFRNPLLAATYRRIAEEGAAGFYDGPVAEAIEKVVAEYGGFLTRADLAAHRADWVEPVGVDYRGYTLWELPPNGQGIAALQMLRILEPYDLASMGPGSADALHFLIEAKKLAFEDRAAYYADPEFANVDVERLVSRAYARERRKLLDPKRAREAYPPGDRILERGDTTYFCVVDSDRNMVSLIQSNYTGFGSGLVPEGCGFTLQNRGNLFSLEPGHPNVYAPGKRPFHTIIPAMLSRPDGRPCFPFGVMGGAMQPQGHAQVVVNLLDFGMNVQEAGDAPRFRHAGSSQPTDEEMTDGGVVYLESGIGAEVRAALRARGHRVENTRGGYGGYQGIWVDYDRGVLLGASESRKDGAAIGY
jgi:gamma-glutamyltranspeptidase/glutathione hydrolase